MKDDFNSLLLIIYDKFRFHWNIKHIKVYLKWVWILSETHQAILYARLKNGRIIPWQCPSPVRLSVRPSVRPRLPDFFQHALRYQFETWYIHCVLGTTCSLWRASHLGHLDIIYSQKYVKHIYCNHGFINQDTFFPGFFVHVLRHQFET